MPRPAWSSPRSTSSARATRTSRPASWSTSSAASPPIRSRAARSFRSRGEDLKQMFAADERAHIEIGTVYPTKDVRGALYVDALLGKHFALLGSTGTGKSTVGRADHAPDLRPVARGPYRDDRSARRIFGRVQGRWRAVQRRQSRHALLADELRGALRGVRHLVGRRAPARHRHPRQMPAPGARQEPRGRGADQAHRRFADPLRAVRPHQRDHQRDGPAQQGDRHRALSCASRPRSTS